MHFYFDRQHTTQYVRIVMKHVLTTAAEVLTVILMFITGALLLAL